ncbi:MAG: DUF1634 domain-containing protein [Elusimicrobiales bacterium]|nr:DUF1634 domain-containing protein [Elusimicrobiales bacterium]
MNKDREIKLRVKQALQFCVGAGLFFLIMGFMFKFARVFHADKFFMTGILILLTAPVIRVITLIYGYAKSGEYKFSVLSLTVLFLLVTAFVL